MSDLTCPEGNAFSISGCNTLCLVCELLVEDPCPPCSIGADKVRHYPVWLVVPRRLCCFQMQLGCALFSDGSLVAGGQRLGMFQKYCFQISLVVRCFQMSGLCVVSDELGCALFSDELGCALFSD